MEAAEVLKQDVREGRIEADRLVDIIARLQQKLHEAAGGTVGLSQR